MNDNEQMQPGSRIPVRAPDHEAPPSHYRKLDKDYWAESDRRMLEEELDRELKRVVALGDRERIHNIEAKLAEIRKGD